VDYISSITLTGQTFTTDVASLDSASPEAKALFSLLVNIQINLVPNTTSSQFRWLQMYTLSTLLAQLPSFKYLGHKCDWDGVKCAFIDLGERTVQCNAWTPAGMDWPVDKFDIL
jgi:hypothetical protein